MGLIETASVVKNHAGGRTVELGQYIEGVRTVAQAGVGQSLRIDLEPGDVYTTVRRHFQVAGKVEGVCLRFRKLVENGSPVALLVEAAPSGSAQTDEE